jgi:hypothetical protein
VQAEENEGFETEKKQIFEILKKPSFSSACTMPFRQVVD